MNRNLILIAILFSACGSGKEYKASCQVPSVEPTKVFTDQHNNFKLMIPEEFDIIEPFSYFDFVAIDSSQYAKQLVTSITVETYELSNDQTFGQFYDDIAERTSEEAEQDSLKFTFDFTDQHLINQRESKISTVTFTKQGITLVTRTFYIKEGNSILTVTVATNKSDAASEFCKLAATINSITKI